MPPPRIDVALAPAHTEPRGRTCLVVDVLRATSVMATLLGRGTRALYPVATVEEGTELRAGLRAEGVDAALCGERDALPPAGYDFGNSPGVFAALERVP